MPCGRQLGWVEQRTGVGTQVNLNPRGETGTDVQSKQLDFPVCFSSDAESRGQGGHEPILISKKPLNPRNSLISLGCRKCQAKLTEVSRKGLGIKIHPNLVWVKKRGISQFAIVLSKEPAWRLDVGA